MAADHSAHAKVTPPAVLAPQVTLPCADYEVKIKGIETQSGKV